MRTECVQKAVRSVNTGVDGTTYFLSLLRWSSRYLEVFRLKAPSSDSKGTTKNVLKRIRESQRGTEKCRRRARDVLYWP